MQRLSTFLELAGMAVGASGAELVFGPGAGWLVAGVATTVIGYALSRPAPGPASQVQ